ncbi:AAA family ATPase [Roseibium sp. SCP14]|uniref:AAA family ATPase n=1 Tax=Roseibium sp. SCP14 TaxID=3141375 RepID=UPI00333B2E06
MKRSNLSAKARGNVGTLVARMAVRKALRRTPEYWHRSAYIIGANLPNDTDTDIYEEALAKELGWQIPKRWKREDLPNFHYFTDDSGDSRFRRKEPFEALSLAKDVAEHQRLVGVCTPKHPMSTPFEDIAEAVVEIRPTPEHIVAALLLARRFLVTKQQANELLSDTLTNLNVAFRGDRPLTRAFQMLRALRKADASEPLGNSNNTAPSLLEDMVGYGEAKSWGVNLARDLKDWRNGRIAWDDVDRGILLVGRPGTGKTVYARSLAETCGAHFVECSLSKMQGLGHLGDMLKGIDRAFRDARKNAPAILFIDEFDAVGNRSTLSSHAPEYATQVITGLLQLMDGTEKRDGVVIVAACNRVDTIDPAFLRPGRLERMVEIPLPDFEARKAIFRQHLKVEVQDTVLSQVSRHTDGMSGADLEQLARDCRRVARRSGETIEKWHLSDTLSAKFAAIPNNVLERSSVHEAGHVVAAFFIKGVMATEVVIREYARLTNGTRFESGGHTALPSDNPGFRVRSDYLDNIAVLLAGRSAEALLCKEPSDSAGLVAGSDLERATLTAARLLASSGLSEELVFRADVSEPALKQMVKENSSFAEACNQILEAQQKRVTALLVKKMPLVKTLADELLKSKALYSPKISSVLNFTKKNNNSNQLNKK